MRRARTGTSGAHHPGHECFRPTFLGEVEVGRSKDTLDLAEDVEYRIRCLPFGQIRELLFDSLVVSDLSYEGDAEGDDIPPPVLRVVPRERALILIQRSPEPGEATYWDEEKDMVVGPEDIALEFLDYFDFSQIPIMDFRFYRCRILSFPGRSEYEGRKALISAVHGRVFHDEEADKPLREQ
jgi:hypothetical protein